MFNLTQPDHEVNHASDPAVRRKIIGATDITRILGFAPESWGTAVDVWMEKTGQKESADLSDVDAVQAGILLEDDVAAMYQRRTGIELAQAPFVGTGDPDYIACHPDYVAADRLVECKVTGVMSPMRMDRREMWGEEGTDQVPIHYAAQCQYQMACSGHDRVDLAVLIGGDGLKIYTIEREDQVCRFLVREAIKFWEDHVQPVLDGGNPKQYAPKPRNSADAALLYPRDNGSDALGTVEHLELAETLANLKLARKDIDAQVEDIEGKLKAAIGNASNLVVDGKVLATWKASVTNRIDTKKLAEMYPDAAGACRTATMARRFLLKVKGVA